MLNPRMNLLWSRGEDGRFIKANSKFFPEKFIEGSPDQFKSAANFKKAILATRLIMQGYYDLPWRPSAH